VKDNEILVFSTLMDAKSLFLTANADSRYVVGWMVAPRESASLAERLIAATCAKQAIRPAQLTIHADRGSSMTSKPVALLLADLGVTRTHSRPHVSNDNPFSEAQFKTLKYRPAFPARFGSVEQARAFCHPFFLWYNTAHRHNGIGLLTPAMVHYGHADTVCAYRAAVLAAAYAAHPERFVRQPPKPPARPPAVWINPPAAITTPMPSATHEALAAIPTDGSGSMISRGAAISVFPTARHFPSPTRPSPVEARH
jgi:putative transposase